MHGHSLPKITNKEDHIKVFGKSINNVVADVKIIITEEDKLQFYIDHMYDNTLFDKEEITKWEKKKKSEKTWVNATAYFEDLVANIKKYQSNSRGTAM